MLYVRGGLLYVLRSRERASSLLSTLEGESELFVAASPGNSRDGVTPFVYVADVSKGKLFENTKIASKCRLEGGRVAGRVLERDVDIVLVYYECEYVGGGVEGEEVGDVATVAVDDGRVAAVVVYEAFTDGGVAVHGGEYEGGHSVERHAVGGGSEGD